MKNEHLQRVLKLINRTGDKSFIIDNHEDEMYMLMNVDSYEDMLDRIDGTLDKPKTGGDTEDDLEDYVLDDIIDLEEKAKVLKEIEAIKSSEKQLAGAVSSAEAEKKLDFTKGWNEQVVEKEPVVEPINSIIKEESLSDVPHDDEEEEKFYLEPVE